MFSARLEASITMSGVAARPWSGCGGSCRLERSGCLSSSRAPDAKYTHNIMTVMLWPWSQCGAVHEQAGCRSSTPTEGGCSNPPVAVHLNVRALRTWPMPVTARARRRPCNRQNDRPAYGPLRPHPALDWGLPLYVHVSGRLPNFGIVFRRSRRIDLVVVKSGQLFNLQGPQILCLGCFSE